MFLSWPGFTIYLMELDPVFDRSKFLMTYNGKSYGNVIEMTTKHIKRNLKQQSHGVRLKEIAPDGKWIWEKLE